MMYVDGDESFTQGGIEYTIGEEVGMKRSENEEFFKAFDAIDRFVKDNKIINNGEARIITSDDDGFCAWLITMVPMKTAYLIVSNYKYPTEKIMKTAATGENYKEVVEGYSVFDKEIYIPSDYDIVNEYILKEKDFEPQPMEKMEKIHFDKLDPSEYRIYELKRH